MPDLKRYSLIRPTLQTKFHIDFDWWSQNDSDWHIHLESLLCPYHQEIFANKPEAQVVDWVDPDTAEVKPVDGIQHVLIKHCAQEPDFITEHTAMVDAIFRLFLSNGNIPMTPVDLSTHLRRPAETILRTLTGGRIYRGVRPCPEC